MDFCIPDTDDIVFSKRPDESMTIDFVDFDAFTSQYHFSMDSHHLESTMQLGLLSDGSFDSIEKEEKLR